MKFDPSSAGSYSVSDEGCRGDVYAVSPLTYPVPGYLTEYDSLRKALRVSTNTCALQQGLCWVIKRADTFDRCGQRCGRGECEVTGPYSPGLAGHETSNPFPDPVRRAVQAQWVPIAQVTPEGVAAVREGCVLPLWRQIYYVGGMQNQFTRQQPGLTYYAAVEAAMLLARQQKKTRVVFGRSGSRSIPVVYVDPGGIVKPTDTRGYATQVQRMDEFQMRQALAASQGASIMPFNM